jgi:DNA topoisomerase-3
MKFRQLIICEKETQMKLAIELFGLNKHYASKRKRKVVFYNDDSLIACIALSGHILELKPPEHYDPSLKVWNLKALPVIPLENQWQLEVKHSKKCFDIMEGIKWAVKQQPDELILASDNDPEGELISWETIAYVKIERHPNITRMIYSSLTIKAFKKAYEHRSPAPFGGKYYMRSQAGVARQRLDWLIGMNVTMALSLVNSKFLKRGEAINSGRVIFAIAYIIYLRQKAIDNFKPLDYYTEKASFSFKNNVYSGKLILPPSILDPDSSKLTDKQVAGRIHEHLLTIKKGVIKSTEEVEKSAEAELGFSRASLEVHMSTKFGFSLKRTRDALQALYDQHSLITYPRVGTKYVDSNAHPEMPITVKSTLKNILSCAETDTETTKVLKAIYPKINFTKVSKMFKKGLEEKESHHAIIPTEQLKNLSIIKPDELLVYIEVSKRLIAQFLEPRKWMSCKIVTSVGKFNFETTGGYPTHAGYTELLPVDNKQQKLPLLNIGDIVDIESMCTDSETTESPPLYDVPALIKAMLNPKPFVFDKNIASKMNGIQIGTEATRGEHVDALALKGYVEIKKISGVERFLPTQKLMSVIELAPPYMKYPETTAFWDEAYRKIENGEKTLQQVMANQTKLIQRFFAELSQGAFKSKSALSSGSEPCSCCDGYVFRMLSSKNNYYWRCSSCDQSFADDSGSIGTKFGGAGEGKPVKGHKSDLECPECLNAEMYKNIIGKKKISIFNCGFCGSSFFDNKGLVGNPLTTR